MRPAISLQLKTNDRVENRLKEFSNLNKQDNDAWFSELCFCILTANSQAKKAIVIQNELGPKGFLNKSVEEISATIKSHGHRFHNNKAKYIVGAREFKNIKDQLNGLSTTEARAFLVKNIKGIGYKEASHFLRNVGYNDVAIIDRHILKFMLRYNLIPDIPKTISPKKYLEFEKKLEMFNVSQSRLDLIIWEKMTGEVLK